MRRILWMIGQSIAIIVAVLFVCVFQVSGQVQTYRSFSPGKVWIDQRGMAIQAHGGGILYHNGIYYWYGENRDTTSNKNPKKYFQGVSCYSSKDLYNWKYEGIVLKPVEADSNHDLYPGKIVERPKVIYNDKYKQFVMWMHIDREGYTYARQGVAISKNPLGPFEYINSVRPNDFDSQDMTIFKDSDGKAYAIYSAENHKAIHICLLSDDFLEHTGSYKRIITDKSYEGLSFFKSRKKYFLISSYGDKPSNKVSQYAMADSIMGNWKEMENPCKGPGADTTFGTQCSSVLPLQGRNESFIFMADQWDPINPTHSRYVWLPIQFNGNKLHIKWEDEWNLSFFSRRNW
jgi:sucrose-6-phosphate hydrolase SacC (GH32 family)